MMQRGNVPAMDMAGSERMPGGVQLAPKFCGAARLSQGAVASLVARRSRQANMSRPRT